MNIQSLVTGWTTPVIHPCMVIVDVAQGRFICVRPEGTPRIPTRWNEFGRFQEPCYNDVLKKGMGTYAVCDQR